MTLTEYLRERKLNDYSFRDSQFAEEIGTDKYYLSQLKTGIRIPSIKLAKKIEKATDGKVNALKMINYNYKLKQERDKEKDKKNEMAQT